MAVPFFSTRDPDEVTIEIDGSGGLFGGGSAYKFWASVEIRRAIDVYSTVTLIAPFERDRKEFRETFKPFSFKPLVVKIGNGTIFTGTMVDVRPNVDPDSSTVSVTGYAKPAVFEDCTAPASLFPLEFRKQKLRTIADKLCSPFNVSVSISGEQGAAFDKVALEPDQKIQDFLADLARQRNLVIADTPQGGLWFRQSVSTGSPVAKLNGQPVTNVEAAFNPQEYYSEITGIGKAKRGKKGNKFTAKNLKLSETRPLTFQLDDTEKADVPAAVRAKLGRMFGNMVSYTVDLPTWRDPDDNLFEPNTTIKLTAPDAMIYSETEFLIRAVTLKRDASSKTCTLELVLPGAFSGEVPSKLPWD